MITKKDFIKIMTEWLKIEQKEDNADNVLKELNPDFGSFPFSPYGSLVIKVLEKDMNCYNNGDGWIGWWLWECLGRKGLKNEGAIIEHDNTLKRKFKLDSLGKLYDYIIKYGQDK